MNSVVPFLDDSLVPAVRGFLHSPADPNGDALILTHGAGSNSNDPLLVAPRMATSFSAAISPFARRGAPDRRFPAMPNAIAWDCATP
jgi:predicted alpha/beta-hydrolase family hydrolase